MAKGFPYFKFIASEWLMGDIVFEDFELQGIFINICALYWQRDGKLTTDEISKRLKTERYQALSGRFFSVSNGFISIKFLDEQLVAAGHLSKTNSTNGKKGAEARKMKRTPSERLPNNSDGLANLSKEEVERELEKEEEVEVKQTTTSVLKTIMSEQNIETSAMACRTTLAAYKKYLDEHAAKKIAVTFGKYSASAINGFLIKDYPEYKQRYEVLTKPKTDADDWG